jgi:hypothetical protein
MIDCIPKFQGRRMSSREMKAEDIVNPRITTATFRQDFDENYEDLSQYVEKYYYPMPSIELDIKQNENNYGVNRSQRIPNKSAYDIHQQDFYNSVKGLVLVDQNLLSGSVSNSMIKRSIDVGGQDEEGVIGDWHPRGRLINTLYPVNCNDLPHPVTSIVVSDDSTALISGSKNGMLHYFGLDYETDEIKIECSESMYITNLDKPKQINSLSILNSETTF